MLLAKFRGIAFALLLLVGLWVLFLVSAHLLLDFEQSKRYIPDVLHFQGSSTLSSILDLEDNEAEGINIICILYSHMNRELNDV